MPEEFMSLWKEKVGSATSVGTLETDRRGSHLLFE
jgi:hypothetical protein